MFVRLEFVSFPVIIVRAHVRTYIVMKTGTSSQLASRNTNDEDYYQLDRFCGDPASSSSSSSSSSSFPAYVMLQQYILV